MAIGHSAAKAGRAVIHLESFVFIHVHHDRLSQEPLQLLKYILALIGPIKLYIQGGQLPQGCLDSE